MIKFLETKRKLVREQLRFKKFDNFKRNKTKTVGEESNEMPNVKEPGDEVI